MYVKKKECLNFSLNFNISNILSFIILIGYTVVFQTESNFWNFFFCVKKKWWI